MKKNPIGIMQGRLLPPVNGRIQAFPEKRWTEEFAAAAELGLDCIEFIFDGDDYTRHPLMTEAGIERIKELESAFGVRVLSICADWFMDNPLHKGNGQRSMSVLKGLISSCSALGVRDIVLPCVDRSRLSGPEEVQGLVHALKECLEPAEEHDINIAIEADLPPTDLLSLLKSFDSPRIKVNYDIGNSASLGYGHAEEIGLYGGWISDVHIKDRVLDGGTVPLGSGSADIPAALEALEKAGFSGPFILQAARGELGHEKETAMAYIEYIGRYLKQG